MAFILFAIAVAVVVVVVVVGVIYLKERRMMCSSCERGEKEGSADSFYEFLSKGCDGRSVFSLRVKPISAVDCILHIRKVHARSHSSVDDHTAP